MVFFSSRSSFAETQKKKKPLKKPNTTQTVPPRKEDRPPLQRLKNSLIRSNIELSELIDSTAEGVDKFLVGKKLTKEANKTTVIIDNSTNWTEASDVSNATGVNVNLRLHNFEKYWQLKFATYDERREERNFRRAYQRQTVRERNPGATIGFLRELGNVRTAFQPRVEFQNVLKVSHSLSFESDAEIATYRIGPKFEFYTSPDRGAGVFARLNVDKGISKAFSLTLINDADHEEKSHLLSVNHGFSIGHSLSDRYGFDYGLIFNSTNLPNYHLEVYTASIAWNHQLYKRVFHYQIVPYLEFPRYTSFRGVTGINLNLSLIF